MIKQTVLIILGFLLALYCIEGMIPALHATEVTPRPLGNDLSVYAPLENDQSDITPPSVPENQLPDGVPQDGTRAALSADRRAVRSRFLHADGRNQQGPLPGTELGSALG